MHWIAAAEKDIATEHWVGNFKLDILCTDGDEQVIIEAQLVGQSAIGLFAELGWQTVRVRFSQR